MNFSPLATRARSRAHFVAALLACVSLAACAATFAQSGRRQQKQPPLAPVPTPTPEPTPVPKEEKVEAKIPLVVVSEDTNYFVQQSNQSYAVQAVAVARLRESRAIEVSGDSARGSRGEAMRRAKESGGRHVVWFELRSFGMGQPARRLPPEEMLVEYSVFETGTAKRLSHGTIHMRRARGPLGGLGLPGCYPRLTNEVEYAIAGLEMAERIMESFSVPLPPRCAGR
ncbi:MAG TPA: hypothetical protein VIP46_04185 [Pyrinomonadaceae bacterium]